jgi:hypothetical protein
MAGGGCSHITEDAGMDAMTVEAFTSHMKSLMGLKFPPVNL